MKYRFKQPSAFSGYHLDKERGNKVLWCHLLACAGGNLDQFASTYDYIFSDEERIYPDYVVGFDELDDEEGRIYPETYGPDYFWFQHQFEYPIDDGEYMWHTDVVGIQRRFLEEINES